MVYKAVQQYIQAGVAGFHIEDQIQNKRCGHLAGKKVVDLEEYLTRIRAAKLAKDRMHSLYRKWNFCTENGHILRLG